MSQEDLSEAAAYLGTSPATSAVTPIGKEALELAQGMGRLQKRLEGDTAKRLAAIGAMALYALVLEVDKEERARKNNASGSTSDQKGARGNP